MRADGGQPRGEVRMHRANVFLGKVTTCHAGLVGHDKDKKTGIVQHSNGFPSAGDPAKPLDRSDEPVIVVEHAVTVEKGCRTAAPPDHLQRVARLSEAIDDRIVRQVLRHKDGSSLGRAATRAASDHSDGFRSTSDRGFRKNRTLRGRVVAGDRNRHLSASPSTRDGAGHHAGS